jgi:hypothetical protein
MHTPSEPATLVGGVDLHRIRKAVARTRLICNPGSNRFVWLAQLQRHDASLSSIDIRQELFWMFTLKV